MAETEQPYMSRWFNARSGEVGLTCCTRCGNIVWNPTLHEREYHAEQDNDEEAGTGEANGSVENSSEKPGLSETGVHSGSNNVPDRPRSGSTGGREGRTTVPGRGKQSSR